MGIDCEILFQTKDGGRENFVNWRPGWRVEPACEADKEEYFGCQYYVYTLCRYFGPYYRRGPWHEIHYHLVQLLRDENVVRVWYGGSGGMTLQPICAELLRELTETYLAEKGTSGET